MDLVVPIGLRRRIVSWLDAAAFDFVPDFKLGLAPGFARAWSWGPTSTQLWQVHSRSVELGQSGTHLAAQALATSNCESTTIPCKS